jgi:hypothetical protein
MPLALLPVLAQFLFWLLEKIVGQFTQDEESRRIFLELAQVMRKAGIEGVRSRFEAESQIDLINAEWDRREKGNQDARKGN